MDVNAGMTRRQVAVRLWAMSLAVLALAAPICVYLSTLGVFLPRSGIAAWLMICPFAATELFLIRLRISGRIVPFSLGLLPFAVGLFMVAPMPLIVAQLIGLAIASAWQRDRVSLVASNVSMYTLNGALVVVVFRAIADPAVPFGL